MIPPPRHPCFQSWNFKSAVVKNIFVLFFFGFFQVDLLVPTKVTGIITQGAKDFGRVQFVGSYKVAYSNDGERWITYQDEKQRKDKVRSSHSQETHRAASPLCHLFSHVKHIVVVRRSQKTNTAA